MIRDTLNRLHEQEWRRRVWVVGCGPDQTEQYTYECPMCGGFSYQGHRAGCSVADCIEAIEAALMVKVS